MDKKERSKNLGSLILLCIAFPLLAFSIAKDIQPHREQEALQTVIGEVEDIRVRTYYRSPHRSAETSFLINNTWYDVPGSYDLGYLREDRERIRLLVDGTNIFTLQTEQRTLLGYQTLAERYQRERRIHYVGLLLIAGFAVFITIIQIKSFKRGDSPFSPKKN